MDKNNIKNSALWAILVFLFILIIVIIAYGGYFLIEGKFIISILIFLFGIPLDVFFMICVGKSLDIDLYN